MTALNIVPECYVDTKVAEILRQAKKYNHQHGCGDVSNEMRTRLVNNTALGIVDEDKNKGVTSQYFGEFEVLREQNNLVLKKHPHRRHYLIFICPKIEKWLLNEAKLVDVKLQEFGLPNELKGFKQRSKIKDIDKDDAFIKFIKALIKKEVPGINSLRNWINQFTENTL